VFCEAAVELVVKRIIRAKIEIKFYMRRME
jgi:hypothetical protein